MKARLIIREMKDNLHMVIIDNGYNNELVMTEKMTFEECVDWIDKFQKSAIITE